MSKIAILGSGAMGTAIANVFTDSNHKDIIIYGIDEQEVTELKEGKNTKYFPESVGLHKFKTTTSIEEALDGADFIVTVVPSIVMDKVVDQIKKVVKNDFTIVNCSKGFYPGTKDSLQDGIEKALENNVHFKGVVSIIGPSHAEEIVKKSPTLLAAVNKDAVVAEKVQKLFTASYFRIYVQTDVIGAEVGGAYKNALAIASGAVYGVGYGINTNAALLTRGIAEMRRFNKAMGGKDETIVGLTGIGDLIVTATSELSRNFSFGFDFAKRGKEALKTNKTVEGLNSLQVILEIAKEKNVSLPILETMESVINRGFPLSDAIETLLNRDVKYE